MSDLNGLWSMLGSLGSASINFGSTAASAKRAYKYAKRLAAQQFEYNKQMMQSRHQWEVDDLRSAGLNPILSSGGSGAAGSTGSGGSVNVHTPEVDLGDAIQSAISLSDQLKNSKKQREQQDLQNAISAEKLKQEKIKTDYIKSDPTYFTPSKSFADVARGLLFPSASKLKELKNTPVEEMPHMKFLLNFFKSAWDWNKRLTPVYNFYQYNRDNSRFDRSIEGSEFLKSGGRR